MISGTNLDCRNYTITAAPKSNGMIGIVYFVTCNSDKKHYSAKTIPRTIAPDDTDVIAGINKLLQIKHPSLQILCGVCFFDFTSRPYPTFFSNFVSGLSLQSMFDEPRESEIYQLLTNTRKLIIIIGISAGMAYLHQCHIIHGDLKPNNILIDQFFYPLIRDFGFTKLFMNNSNVMLPKDITALAYIPPEVFGGKDYGWYSDVYSFGIILYQLLTNIRPFNEIKRRSALIRAIKNGHHPLFEEKTEVPKLFIELIEKCWSQNIDQRPAFDHIYLTLMNDSRYTFDGIDIDGLRTFKDKMRTYFPIELSQENERRINNAVNNNNYEDYYYVGISMIHGINGFVENTAEGVNFLKEAADSGVITDAEADFGDYLVTLGDSESYTLAVNYLNSSISKGVIKSKCRLSFLYKFGFGVQQDLETAHRLLREAAEEGCIEGLNEYGQVLENGEGSQRVPEEASKYYRRAMELGSNQGKALYGRLLIDGNGVPKNVEEGSRLIIESMKSGDKTGINTYGYMFEKGIGVNRDVNLALKYYKIAADKGNSYALNNYGRFLEKGIIIKQNLSEAVEYYYKASCLGDTYAMNSYARCLEKGIGTSKDIRKASKFYKMAADAGDMFSIVHYAIMLENGSGVPKNEVLARKYYQFAADCGNTNAMNRLGFCLQNGKGGPKDELLAAKYYKVAADKGNGKAMTNIGCCYKKGIGFEKNETEAVRYYKMASDIGDIKGTNKYARCLETGFGVEKNESEAIQHYIKGIEKGDSRAMTSYAFCLYDGDGIERNIPKAIEYFKMAIEKGDSHAMSFYSFILKQGRYVERDIKESLRYKKMAADAGHLISQNAYADILLRGEIVPPDEKEAIKYFQMAANQNNVYAIERLGKMYSKGFKCEKNEVIAAQLFKKSANIKRPGSESGTEKYGYCLLFGIGVPKDEVEAAKYYKIAAEKGNIKAVKKYACMLFNGIGVKKDVSEAKKYFKKVDLYNDCFFIMKNMDDFDSEIDKILLERCTDENLNKNSNNKQIKLAISLEKGINGQQIDFYRAMQIFKKIGIEERDDICICKYARHIQGIGTIKNLHEAMNLFKIAADRGNVIAMANLAEFYFNGEILSLTCLRIAVEGPMDRARHLYSSQYLKGNRNDSNKNEAEKYFKMAADSGHVYSMMKYGLLLSMKDQPEFTEEANKYFKMAADTGNEAAIIHYEKIFKKEENYEELLKHFKMEYESNNFAPEKINKNEADNRDLNEGANVKIDIFEPQK